ncbi:MAG: hypothetical protein ACYSTG_05835 [Planctomycetota bacterium]
MKIKIANYQLTKSWGGPILILLIRITIPAWLERIAVRLVLPYRCLRFGHPFRRIPLTQGKYAIVDPEDYPRLTENTHAFSCTAVSSTSPKDT